jgi:hypothetical protein
MFDTEQKTGGPRFTHGVRKGHLAGDVIVFGGLGCIQRWSLDSSNDLP